jgi:hypothetical protein
MRGEDYGHSACIPRAPAIRGRDQAQIVQHGEHSRNDTDASLPARISFVTFASSTVCRAAPVPHDASCDLSGPAHLWTVSFYYFRDG